MSEYVIKRKVECDARDCFHGYIKQSLNARQIAAIETGQPWIPGSNEMLFCGRCNRCGYTLQTVTLDEFFRDAEIQYHIQRMLKPKAA